MSAVPKWTPGKWEIGIANDGAWFLLGDVEEVPGEEAGEVKHRGTLICISEMPNKYDGYLLLVSKEMYKELAAAVVRCPNPGCVDCVRVLSLLEQARGEQEDPPEGPVN